MGLGSVTRQVDGQGSTRGGLLRFGTVTSVDAKTGTAKVRFDDADGLVSMPLRVIQDRTLKDKHQHLPDVGEQVACVSSGQSRGNEEGVVLGSFWSEADASPAHDAHVDYHMYADGTEIEYDREKHTLTANVKGTVDVKATGHIAAQTDDTAAISAKGAVTVSSQASITLSAPTINIKGFLNVCDQSGGAGTCVLKGDVRHEGNYEQQGDFQTSGEVKSGTLDTGTAHITSLNSNSHGH